MMNFEVYPIGRIQNNENGTVIEIAPKYIPAMKALEGLQPHQRHLVVLATLITMTQGTRLTHRNRIKMPLIQWAFSPQGSPIRPNPIALTAVEVIHIDYQKGLIQIAYIDANDNTPVLDIKPYTPSLDRVQTPGVPEWCSHWPKSLEQSAYFAWEDEFNF